MTGLCLGLAAVIQFAIPVDHCTVTWSHSIEKIRWEEDYRADGDQIIAEAARVKGFGAGMEIPERAIWHDGYWEYRPHLTPLRSVRLTRSSFTADYQICWDGECHTLTDLLGPAEEGAVVELFACPAGG